MDVIIPFFAVIFYPLSENRRFFSRLHYKNSSSKKKGNFF
jgi:hypothetical protein